MAQRGLWRVECGHHALLHRKLHAHKTAGAHQVVGVVHLRGGGGGGGGGGGFQGQLVMVCQARIYYKHGVRQRPVAGGWLASARNLQSLLKALACSMTMRFSSGPGSRLPPGRRTPKKSGARGATLAPCACSAATRAEVGVKPAPTGTQLRLSAGGK